MTTIKNLLYYVIALFFILSCSSFSYNNPRDPLSPQCGPPENITASQGTFNHIKISWDTMAYASRYLLLRSDRTGGEKSFTIPAESRAGYLDYDVEADTNYSYSVRAVLKTGITTAHSSGVKGWRNKPAPVLTVKFARGDDDSFLYDTLDYSLDEQTGRGRILGFKIELDNSFPGLSLRYKAHFSGVGDIEWIDEGKFLETRYRGCYIEAFAIETAGEKAGDYDIYYQAVLKGGGLTEVRKNGRLCGTTGKSHLIRSFKIWIKKKR